MLPLSRGTRITNGTILVRESPALQTCTQNPHNLRKPRPADRPSGRVKTFSSLQNHINYRYLWTGNLFANCAQWLQFITIGWLALDISGSALHSILTVAVRALPFLLLVKNGSDQFTGVVDQLMLA